MIFSLYLTGSPEETLSVLAGTFKETEETAAQENNQAIRIINNKSKAEYPLCDARISPPGIPQK